MNYINYPYLKSRKGIWGEIVRYVYRDVGMVENMLEIGPGYCDFINQYPSELKVAVDINE